MTSLQQRILSSSSRRTQLLKTLAETDYAASALQQDVSYLEDLGNEINLRTRQLAQLSKIKDKELADHEKYQHSKVRRMLFRLSGRKAHFTARAEKEEREYFQAMQALHQAGKVLALLKNDLSEAVNKHQKLKSVVALHQATQAELETLYDSIFEGDTPEFPEEDAKERPTNAAEQIYNELRLCRDNEAHVQALLKEAGSSIARCSANLAEASRGSETDIWCVGSRYSEMAEKSPLAQAQSLAFQAEMLISQARRLQPLVQSIGLMNIAEGHVVGDAIFDNISSETSDSSFDRRIWELSNQVIQAMKNLNVEIAVSARRLRTLQFETDVAKVRLDDARNELLQVRTAAFEQFAANLRTREV